MHTNYLQSTSLQDTSLASNLPSNYLSNYLILSGLSGGRPKVTEGYYSNIPYGFFPAGRGDGRDCGFCQILSFIHTGETVEITKKADQVVHCTHIQLGNLPYML